MLKIIKSLLSSQQRYKIKRNVRKFKSTIQFWVKSMTIDEMEKKLRNELGIKEGDAVFISSAFGSLKATFSPKDLIELMMKIVGENGVIMMPYYPPGSSTEWAASGNVFDMASTKSSMGVLTNVFSEMPGVIMSEHPTKAVCVWGNNAKSIASGHAECKSPFSAESPYGKLFLLHSKSLGIATDKCSMGHCFEDMLNPSLSQYYSPISMGVKANGKTKYYDTLLHDTRKLKIRPGKFIKGCMDYKMVKTGYTYSYVIANDKAFEYYKQEFAVGRSSLID